MDKYKMLNDIPIWITKGGPKDPDELRQLARMIDVALLFEDDCKAYIKTVLATLMSAKKIRHGKDAAYLEPLPDNRVDELLVKPFSRRTTDELRRLRLADIAMNVLAIDQLFERLAEKPLNDEWLDIHDEECDRFARMEGIGWPDVERIANKCGIRLSTTHQDAMAMARAVQDDEEEKDTTIEILLHIKADNQRIQWKSGNPKDATPRYLDVEIVAETPRKLRVRTGGIGYLETGCAVTIRWLADHGKTINAEGSCQDEDRPLVLDAAGGKALLPTHEIEIDFERTTDPCYHFVARLPIRSFDEERKDES